MFIVGHQRNSSVPLPSTAYPLLDLQFAPKIDRLAMTSAAVADQRLRGPEMRPAGHQPDTSGCCRGTDGMMRVVYFLFTGLGRRNLEVVRGEHGRLLFHTDTGFDFIEYAYRDISGGQRQQRLSHAGILPVLQPAAMPSASLRQSV